MRQPTLLVCCWILVAGAGGCGDRAPEPTPDNASADTPSEVSVTIAPVVRTTLHGYATGWGTVAPESATAGRPPANATITAPVPGLITAIQCSEGERVRQGETLFRLDSRLADAAVERAQQAVEFAQSVVQRQEQLGPGLATSQRAYQDARQQLAAAQSELETMLVERKLLDVLAPIDGTVTRINATLGDAIDRSTVLAELIDLNRLVVDASIRSVDIPRVARGQHVDLSPGTAPDAAQSGGAAARVTASVEYIGAQVDGATDTVLVRSRVPPGSGLRPGQFVNVRILIDERPDELAVPVDSIVQGSDGPEVAIVEGDSAVRTRVTTGLAEGGLIQVQGEALREGMSVVVQGAYGLPARSKIRVIAP